jgi:hypothetical protein
MAKSISMHFQNKITNHGKWDVFVECLATDALFDVTISRSLDDQLLGRVVRAEMPTLHDMKAIVFKGVLLSSLGLMASNVGLRERSATIWTRLNHNSGISWRRLPFRLPGL